MVKIEILDSSESNVTVKISGEFSSTSVDSFNEGIADVMNNAGREITLDLSDMTFVSSAGLRVFLLLSKRAGAAGGSINIVGILPEILEVIHLTGFDEMFNIKN